MLNLDKINFAKEDKGGMLEKLEFFDQNCRAAWGLSQSFVMPSYYFKAKKFLVLGMGASGISGNVIFDLIFKSDSIIQTVHDYDIPGWVDKDTIVIACSYSGNTEETLHGFTQAYERKAKLIAIAGGGKLVDLAKKYQAPLIKFDFQSQPREAFPYLFILLFSILHRLNVIDMRNDQIEESFNELYGLIDQLRGGVNQSRNEAKRSARSFYGRIPYIFGSGVLNAAAIRFKDQINENCKSFASYDFFPELNHNALEGLNHLRKDVFIIILESKYAHPRVLKRIEITETLLKKNRIDYKIVKFKSNSPLSEVLQGILYGDFISFYLAMLYKENPVAIPNIKYLKEKLG